MISKEHPFKKESQDFTHEEKLWAANVNHFTRKKKAIEKGFSRSELCSRCGVSDTLYINQPLPDRVGLLTCDALT